MNLLPQGYPTILTSPKLEKPLDCIFRKHEPGTQENWVLSVCGSYFSKTV